MWLVITFWSVNAFLWGYTTKLVLRLLAYKHTKVNDVFKFESPLRTANRLKLVMWIGDQIITLASLTYIFVKVLLYNIHDTHVFDIYITR
jgi:hypothetical protein